MIVEAFDPFNNVESGLGSGFVSELMDALDLQGLEEALHRCIIPAVDPAAHRLQHAEIGDQPPVAAARVLAPAVGMHDQSRRRFAPPIGCLQRVADEVGVQPMAHRPPDDPPAGQIHDHREIQPALDRAEIGDVGDPGTIDFPTLEPARKDVGRHRQAVLESVVTR